MTATMTITINRPEQRNALSLEVLKDLHGQVDRIGQLGDAGPHVVAITGAGRAFCAGMDLKEVLGSQGRAEELLLSLARLTWKIRMLRAVVVGVVNGPAIGGGCGLVTVCDLAITYAENKMGFPEVDLGVCPAVVAPWLVRKVGGGRARKILLEGGLMSGLEAHGAGIVTHLVQGQGDVAEASASIIKRLEGGSALALRATKGLLNELDGSMDVGVLERAARLSAEVLSSEASQAMLRTKLGV